MSCQRGRRSRRHGLSVTFRLLVARFPVQGDILPVRCRMRLTAARGSYERSSLRWRRFCPPVFRRAPRAGQRARRCTSARGMRRPARRSPASAPTRSSVREDGARREVLRVTPATSPMPVAILVDNSQAARDHIADIRKALDHVRQGASTASARSRSSASPIGRRSCATTPPIRSSCWTASARCSRCPTPAPRCSTRSSKPARASQKREEDRAAMVVADDREHRVQHPALQRRARRHWRRAARCCTRSC